MNKKTDFFDNDGVTTDGQGTFLESDTVNAQELPNFFHDSREIHQGTINHSLRWKKRHVEIDQMDPFTRLSKLNQLDRGRPYVETYRIFSGRHLASPLPVCALPLAILHGQITCRVCLSLPQLYHFILDRTRKAHFSVALSLKIRVRGVLT